MALMQLLGWDAGLNLFIIHLPNVYNYPQFPQPIDAIYRHFLKSTLRPIVIPTIHRKVHNSQSLYLNVLTGTNILYTSTPFYPHLCG